MTDIESQTEAAQEPYVRAFVEQLRRDPPGVSTDNRLEQSRHFHGIVYTAISAKTTGLEGATLRVMERDTGLVFRSKKANRALARVRKSPDQSQEHHDDELREADSSNPFVRLFDHVNENDDIADLLTDWGIQRNLTGSAPLWVRPSKLRTPCELYILPTALLFPVPISPAFPMGAWRVQQYYPTGVFGVLPAPLTGSGILLDGREIKRHRKRHPLFRWDGYSPLTAGGVQIDVLESIDQSRKAAMDHGFNPDAVIAVEGATTPELNRLAADFRNTHGGSYNARKVLFTGGKKVDVDKLQTAPKEMDYAAGWDQMVKFGLALFGVPPTIAGLVDAGSYSQLFASLKQFYTLTLLPECRSIARFLTKHVVRPYEPDTLVQIDLPEIDDKELQEKQLAADATAGTITYNEYRGIRGRAEWPITGDTQLPSGDNPVGKESAPPMPDLGGGLDIKQTTGPALPAAPSDDSAEGALPDQLAVKSYLASVLKSLR